MASKALERYRENIDEILKDGNIMSTIMHKVDAEHYQAEVWIHNNNRIREGLFTEALTLARELGLAAIGEDWQHAFNCGASAASRADPDHDPAEAFESQCRCGAVERNNLVATQRTTLTELTEGGK